MSRLIYAALMILLTPLLLLGLVFYAVPILASRGRVSGTTYEPFTGRLLFHLLGSRPDPATLTLSGGLPATNRVVMATIMRPLAWASEASGYLPAFAQYPAPQPTPFSGMVAARCEFFDAAILDAVEEGMQIVILGAGWDTRAFGLTRERAETVFEVDAPGTQAVKRAAIEKTGLDASHVSFVPCDFDRQSWLEALKEHGFDEQRRTFILWEGVSMYLEEHAIESTLRTVASLPEGSRIAFDVLSREFLESAVGKSMARSIRMQYGEPWIFSLAVAPDFTVQMREYLEKHGLALQDQRLLGSETTPHGGLLVARTGRPGGA